MLVKLDEAGGQLPELVERALAGEEVIISRGDEPAVRLVPVPPQDARPRPTFGSMSHLITGDVPLERFLLSDDDLRELGFGPYID